MGGILIGLQCVTGIILSYYHTTFQTNMSWIISTCSFKLTVAVVLNFKIVFRICPSLFLATTFPVFSCVCGKMADFKTEGSLVEWKIFIPSSPKVDGDSGFGAQWAGALSAGDSGSRGRLSVWCGWVCVFLCVCVCICFCYVFRTVSGKKHLCCQGQ